MKKLFYVPIFIYCLLIIACKSDDQASDPGNYQTPLPEATQTGKGTFACYVDGIAYIAKPNEITSYYQQYTQGYYVFSVSGAKEEKPIFSISLGSSDVAFVVGTTYDLNEKKYSNQWGGGYFVYDSDGGYESYTNGTTYKGEFTITKLDSEKQIISGTFWFDVKEPKTGKTRKVRDGRFDVVANF